MSEGEFKKRILSMDIEEEDAVRVATFLDVLVEAKKDFERLIHGTWTVDEEGWHDNVYAKDSWLTPSEAIKWFRKWFGEKE